MDILAMGAAIKHSRERAGLSQAELGDQIGAPQSYVARIESGADVRVSTLLRVLSALGLSLKLGGDVEDAFRNPPPGSKIAAARDFGVDLGQLYASFRMSPEARLDLAAANSQGLAELLD
jgi:transcriptional regulator with XRE-family HTH domain